MNRIAKIIGLFGLCLLLSACATKKKKGETSWLGKIYHNTTAKFNGYYNADVILKESLVQLDDQHQDNYNQILDLYTYSAVENPAAVAPELDRAIEKVTTVAALHEPSKWVDDCYLLLGKAQYLKQDYESAEETFEYFIEEFNPNNPSSRLFQSKNLDPSESRKVAAEARKDEQKRKREEVKKARDAEKKAKEEERKRKEKEKEEERKRKEEERKRKQKEREAEKKAKEQARKDRNKGKKNSRSTKRRKAKKEEAPKETQNTEQSTEKSEDEVKTVSPDTTAIVDSTKHATTSTENKEEGTRITATDVIIDPNAPLSEDDEWAESGSDSKDVTKKPDPTGGGLFKHELAYYEGAIWMAKTYTEREKYYSAEYILKNLRNEANLPKDVIRELPVAEAYVFLKQKDYKNAIPALEEAISVANDRNKRARYAYIQAQIYQIEGQQAKAYAAFERAKKFKPSYEMSFNAELSMAKNAWVAGNESSESVNKRLEKMLKEDKNADYADQIYFTIGQVNLKAGKRDEAIEAFRNSIAYNVNNKNQKTESYYALAKLYYDVEEYVNAKNYYDSTLTFMAKIDERYKGVERYSKNLKEIANNIQIIELQDSLLKISELSYNERKAIALEILKERKTENAKGSEDPSQKIAINRGNIGRRARAGQSSSFFAYNPIVLDQGRRDFKTKWGPRNLEDDWRRSSKQSAIVEENITEEEDSEDFNDITEAEMRSIMKDVPMNPDQKSIAHKKIQDAMYELGTQFRDRIQNYSKSIETHEALLERYPETEKELDALFSLYLSNLDVPNQQRANFYKDIIVSKYPGTKYASALNNPDFAKTLAEDANDIEVYYDETYSHFVSGNYQQVSSRVQESKDLFGSKNELSAKFELLDAMTQGNLEGQEAYIQGLRGIIAKYPNTPEETRAREILRFLNGDDRAFDEILYEEALEQFSLQDDRLHYMIFYVNDLSEDQIQTLKADIVRYNNQYHKLDRLRAPSEIYIDRESNAMIVLLRKFNNRDRAMRYFDSAQKNKEDFISEEIPYEMFAITQQNYREVLKQKSVNNYRVFFEASYLEESE